MKNIIKITVLSSLLVMSVVSCNDEFLERYPLAAISDGSYWKSVVNVRMYANNWYNYAENNNQNCLLPTYHTYSIGPWQNDASLGYFEGNQNWGLGSDIQVYGSYNQRLNGEWVPYQDYRSFWTVETWDALRNINYFMANYQAADASFDDVKQYVGEALFFRSIFYYEKLRRFGDLPYTSELIATTSDILYASRMPRNQVVDSIMADLDNAVKYLRPRGIGGYTGTGGRVTMETAMALQARIALYEGTWEKYHAGTPFGAAVNQSQKFLQKAADVAGSLISMSESNGYPKLDNVGVANGYRDLFNRVGAEYESSNEVLFWRRAVFSLYTGHWPENTASGGGVGATKNMIDSYLKADGTPVASGYDDATLVKVSEGRDPRLAQTICIDGGDHFRYANAVPTPSYFVAPGFDGSSCPTGYQLYKGHNFRVAQNDTRESGLNGLIYFRFGEVLLIYAEAKAELGSITQGDLDRSINKLRDRVSMPHMSTSVASDPNFEFASLDPKIQAIRRERKVELAFEGFRPDDIMRWAAAGELIVGKLPKGAKRAQWENFDFSACPFDQTQTGRQPSFTANFEDIEADANGYIRPFGDKLGGGYQFNVNRDYLLPIPFREFTLNKQMTQNPGWPTQ